MLTLRAARSSALRLSRATAAATSSSSSTSHVEIIVPLALPHAESSSAPFRRQLSSTSRNQDANHAAHASEASAEAEEGDSDGRAEGKGKNRYRTNPRLRRQAMANAKKLAEALKSEATSRPSLPPSAKQDVPLPSSSGDSFWADMLVKPATTTFPAASSSSSTTASTTSASSSAPTIEDLLAKRPDYAPREPWHPRYPKTYRRIYNSIDSAFVLKQMRDFARDLNIGTSGRTRNNKSLIIKKIMRSWDWMEPMPKPVERPPESKVFDLPASELFLFLRDNEFVQSFAQNEGDPLELSVIPFSQAPKSVFYVEKPDDEGRMVILATGRDEPLARLNAALKERKESIQTVEFSKSDIHGQHAPVELLQVVSNATGAFVEPISDDRYRATAMSVEEAEEAKRLLSVAVLRNNILPSSRSLSTILPVPPHFHASSPPINKFSLYPFTPSLTEPLSWDLAAQSYSKSLFRLKKVRNWNNKPAMRELDQKQENMEDGQVKAATSMSTTGSGVGNSPLHKILSELLAHGQVETSTEAGAKRLTASFGHLLYPIAPKDGRIGTWDSPLPGQWYLETLQKWLIDDEARIPFFAPSLTPAMIQYPLSGATRQIRRLRYRSIPSSALESGTKESRFISFTYTHASESAVTASDAAQSEEQGSQPEEKWQDRLGDFLDQMEKEIEAEETGTSSSLTSGPNSGSMDIEAAKETSAEVKQVQGETTAEETTPVVQAEVAEEEESTGVVEQSKLEIVAERGVIRELDLHIPDRPTDARFTSISSNPLAADAIPENITHLFRSYLGRSDATISAFTPAYVELEGTRYELELDEYLEVNEDVGPEVVRRMVRAVDQGLGGHGKPVVYNEIELSPTASEGSIPDEFFRELAMVTRDIGPDASALNRNAAGGTGGNPLIGLGSWDQ
ncbi:hypothetical protein IAU59_005742 [Kwoniella sp. CBS 9459]